MGHNNYRYQAVGASQFDELSSTGVAGSNYSKDGLFVICKKIKNKDYSWVVTIPRPNYISIEDAPNWPDELTHKEVKKAKRIWKLEDV